LGDYYYRRADIGITYLYFLAAGEDALSCFGFFCLNDMYIADL
jgi:hypothetical protein